MGYGSQVCLAIRKVCYNEHSTKELKKSLKNCDSITESPESLFFSWDCVKWYESFEEVQQVENFVSEHGDDSGLLVIGEDLDDVRRKGSPNLGVYLLRSIETDEGTRVDVDSFFADNAVKFIENIKK